MRFGGKKEECLKAIDIGFELSPKVVSEGQNIIYKGALKTLELVGPLTTFLFESCAQL